MRKRDIMVKHCIYCRANIDDNSVIDFCQRCGIGVWGEKMFKAILEGMEKARDSGDLHQGSVSEGQTMQARGFKKGL